MGTGQRLSRPPDEVLLLLVTEFVCNCRFLGKQQQLSEPSSLTSWQTRFIAHLSFSARKELKQTFSPRFPVSSIHTENLFPSPLHISLLLLLLLSVLHPALALSSLISSQLATVSVFLSSPHLSQISNSFAIFAL